MTINPMEGLLENERIDDLQRNGLKIIQKTDGFCFGMDAVLLSGFAHVKRGEKVLDMGTGTGIIPLLLSAKTQGEHFTALEIQKEIAEMAARSVAMNHLEDKIEIVLKNYITNAVSHCSGIKTIQLDCVEKEHLFEISVFNTGFPISESDMPEIWDSFYRADKAHGRSENRFGLGLSIVKSIMDNHSCRCEARNVENGVVFTFEVSKDTAYYDNKQ